VTGRTWTHTAIIEIASAHAVEFSKTAKPSPEGFSEEETYKGALRPEAAVGRQGSIALDGMLEQSRPECRLTPSDARRSASEAII
jgi:hypothetical protein